MISQRDEIEASRGETLRAMPASSEPYDLVQALDELRAAAAAADETALAAALRTEVIAAGTHAQPAGLPEAPARFEHVSDELREAGALEVLANRAADPEMPALARAHYLDMVWCLERGGRVHPLAGSQAARAYLTYVQRHLGLPDIEADAGEWFRFSDALARSAELARETGQRELAKQVAGEVKARMVQADAEHAYRLALEPVRGLLQLVDLVPDALAGIAATLERARLHFLATKQYPLARGVLELEYDVAKVERGPADDFRRRLADSFVQEADERMRTPAGALVAGSMLEDAIEIYQRLPKSKDAVATLTARLEAMNRTAGGEMKTVSARTSVPTEEVEQYLAWYVQRPVPEALALVGYRFLSDRVKAYEQHDAHAKTFVFQHLVSKKVITDYGETISLPPGTPERREHDVYEQALLGIAIGDSFLEQIVTRLRSNGLSVEDVLEHLRGCPFFTPESLDLIERGLRSLFASDYVAAVHILVPQFESVLRTALSAAGVPVTALREGHLQMIVLDGLLTLARRHALIDDRIIFTLELVLTGKGENVRNTVAHGWLRAEACTPELGARLLQLALALGLLRLGGEPEPSS